jgi:hypothetical protein
MSCWSSIQFRSKREQQQDPMVEHTEKSVKDHGDVSDVSDSKTYQLLESNVAALENMSQGSQSDVRERVASWLETSINCGINCRDRKEISFTARLFQRIAFKSTPKSEHLWREPQFFHRCESSNSGISAGP